MLLNPFSLRKRLHEYVAKYAKQAVVIVHLKGGLAKLHHENDRLQAENTQLKQSLKEKDGKLVKLHHLISQVDLEKTIEFHRQPRKVRRQLMKKK